MARKITIEFLGDSKDLQKAMDDAGSRGGKLTSVLGKVGKAAAVGLGVGVAVAAKGLYDATQAAGDMNETLSKTNAIFGGKQAETLEAWASGAAQSLGQSKQTALDAAATFGTFGKAAGKSGEDLAKFAMENTQLATDLASFHNTSPEQAIEAIGAAFRGEAEPMRAYGVLLDDASMRQQALKMGLIETTSQALTPQQKVLAAQALMMKQTSDAQGDFEKTSGGLANQQKILKAELANVSVEIGTKLLPAATAVATWFNDKGLPAIKAFGGWLEQNFPPIFERIQAVVSTVMGALKGDVSGGLGRVRDIFANVTSIITSLWNRFGGALTDYAVKSFANVKQIIGGALKVVQGIFQTFSSLLKGDWAGAWDGIKKIVSGAWEVIKGVVKQALNIMSTLMEVGWSAVKGIVSTAWDGIKTAVSKGVARVIEFVREIPGKALSALGNLGSTLSTAGQNLIQGLIDGITAKLGALKDKLLSVTKLIPDWKGPLDKDKILLTPAGEALMEGLINGIDKKKKELQSVLEKITDHIKKKQDALATLLDKRQSIVDSFKGMASSVFGASLGTEESPASVDKLVEFQRNQRGRAEQLNSSVGTLVGKGLSKDLINQLIASGQSGVDQINLLATATDAQIADLVANNAATQAALEAAGLKASEALIGDQIAQAERDVVLADTIRDKLKELLEQQDKNTVVQLILDGKVLHASLLKLKREKRGKLELA